MIQHLITLNEHTHLLSRKGDQDISPSAFMTVILKYDALSYGTGNEIPLMLKQCTGISSFIMSGLEQHV